MECRIEQNSAFIHNTYVRIIHNYTICTSRIFAAFTTEPFRVGPYTVQYSREGLENCVNSYLTLLCDKGMRIWCRYKISFCYFGCMLILADFRRNMRTNFHNFQRSGPQSNKFTTGRLLSYPLTRSKLPVRTYV